MPTTLTGQLATQGRHTRPTNLDDAGAWRDYYAYLAERMMLRAALSGGYKWNETSHYAGNDNIRTCA